MKRAGSESPACKAGDSHLSALPESLMEADLSPADFSHTWTLLSFSCKDPACVLNGTGGTRGCVGAKPPNSSAPVTECLRDTEKLSSHRTWADADPKSLNSYGFYLYSMQMTSVLKLVLVYTCFTDGLKVLLCCTAK